MLNLDGLGGAIIIFGIICAVVGWGVIEFILWLFSFVHISFGG
ncbi:Uncharacterised protein [Klebsiella pneumoniae]|nr:MULTISPECIES: hypothetical protein [Klebsiella]MDJ1062447.1 hypothetical protein [Klebsiella pneumoniae]SBY99270.1 Uncharacterised protein [Klebsiella pneumoniae]SVJ39799.1 Uncharacterised protein [Klebsiella pneumoniae]